MLDRLTRRRQAAEWRRLIERFIAAETWTESRSILEQHPKLLSEEVDQLLAELIESTRREGREDLSAVLGQHRALLQRCRTVGTDQAFAELDAGDQAVLPPELRSSLQRGRDATGRFEDGRDLPALDEAITAWEETLRHPVFLVVPGPTQVEVFNNLGFLWIQHYERTGAARDVEQAITAYQRSVAVATQSSMDRSWQLGGLGSALRALYLNTGNTEDLEAAIETLDLAMAETPPGSDLRAMGLTNLGGALGDRYGRTGDVRDLERSIAASEQALEETPPGASRTLRINNLGSILWLQYGRTNELGDLERVIQTYERAVREATPDSNAVGASLTNLGRSLQHRYTRLGDPEDLKRAIDLLEQAAPMSSTSTPESAGRQSSLGTALNARSERSGGLGDLYRSVEAYERAAAEAPFGSPEYVNILHLLGTGLIARYDRDRDFKDLSRAIEVFEQTVEQTPAGSPSRANRLSNLGATFFKRFMRRGNPDDLTRAIDTFEQVATAHPSTPVYLGNLGASLAARYRRTRDRGDLDRAIAALEQAVAGSPSGSPQLPQYLSNLASALVERYKLTSASADLRPAVDAYRRACVEGARSDPDVALSAGREWGGWAAGRQSWPEAADAFGFAIQASNLLVGVQLTRAHKETWLRAARDLAPAAAYALARTGRVEEAAVVLEQGRAVLLSEALQRGHAQALAPPSFADVTGAAVRPLVYLVAADGGGMALIVGAGGAGATVCWLPQLTHGALLGRMEFFRGSYAQRTRNRAAWFGALDATLGWLWGAIMSPLLAALGSVPAVTLIPYGLLDMLPLHAAWTRDEARPSGRRYALDSIALSYAPNARALANAQALVDGAAPAALLAVDEPLPVTAAPLPFSASEVAAASGYFDRAKVLRHEAATRAAVLEDLANYPVHHLSCHGRADPEAPLESALLMAGDELLTLGDLLELRLAEPPRNGAQLAVLSACETDMPGTELLDEVTSLSTGLLQAGLGGVIASQWAVPGVATALLMTRFYTAWRADGLDPAQALSVAQRWVRDSTNAEMLRYLENTARTTGGDGGGLPATAADELAEALLLRPRGERSFLHPAVWAAFAHVGA